MSNVVVAQSEDDLFEIAGLRTLALGSEAIAKRGRFTLALSGGSTPQGLHAFLTQPAQRDKLDWSKALIFWGDERSVPSDHVDSNFRMAKETLIDPLGISPNQYLRMPADASNLQQAAATHQAEIAELFPGESPPRLDLILLGMGDDGHTASLFPNTEALVADSKWIVANHVSQLDTWRMTMTYPLINAAANVLFLVKGANKADRLHEVLHGELDANRLPSQNICPINGNVTWIVDKTAAASLPCV